MSQLITKDVFCLQVDVDLKDPDHVFSLIPIDNTNAVMEQAVNGKHAIYK